MAHNVRALLDEITQLRARLLFYEKHHHQCLTIRQPSPLSDEECLGTSTFITVTADSIEQSTRKSKPKLKDTRCDIVAIELVEGMPDARGWSEMKEKLKINDTTISVIGGAPINPIVSVSDSHFHSAAGTADLVTFATAFAKRVRGSQVDATFRHLVKEYQEYILVSLCVVMEQHGISIDVINEVMRECISESSDEYLQRLRCAAIWLNQTIVELQATTHWGGRVGEAIFISGLPMSKIVRLWANKQSRQDIIDKLRDEKYTSDEVRALNDTPFSIPAFIKTIVMDKLTLRDICVSLGYDDSVEDITHICRKYKDILNKHPTKKRKLDGNPLDWEPFVIPEQLKLGPRYDPFMGAEDSAEVGRVPLVAL